MPTTSSSTTLWTNQSSSSTPGGPTTTLPRRWPCFLRQRRPRTQWARLPATGRPISRWRMRIRWLHQLVSHNAHSGVTIARLTNQNVATMSLSSSSLSAPLGTTQEQSSPRILNRKVTSIMSSPLALRRLQRIFQDTMASFQNLISMPVLASKLRRWAIATPSSNKT